MRGFRRLTETLLCTLARGQKAQRYPQQGMVIKEAAPVPGQAVLRREERVRTGIRLFFFLRGILPSVLPTFPAAFYSLSGQLEVF